jgi:ribosomal protein S18 acetylase RimI-like enzyme
MNTSMQLSEVTIRTDLRPGDLGYVIHRHGTLYYQEYQYGLSFESYVAGGLHEFYQGFDPKKDRVWIAEHGDKMIGFLLLIHRPAGAAQLRYFLIDPPYRGIGLGKEMMRLYMEFYRAAGFSGCYLWTTHEQTAAALLYKKHGFILTQEKESTAFGKLLKEQRYDLRVPS